MEFDVNLFAVAGAAIVNMAVGFAWYSPYLFAKKWMAESGVNMGEGQSGMAQSLFVAAIASLVMSYVLALVLGTFRASTISDALFVAFAMWLGFIASVMTGLVSWEQKSWTLYSINAGYWLVSLLLMASLIFYLS